jgi:hypothetical protein
MYQLELITSDGRSTVLRGLNNFHRALRVAAPALRKGTIRDARIVDNEGNERADLAAIKTVCGLC